VTRGDRTSAHPSVTTKVYRSPAPRSTVTLPVIVYDSVGRSVERVHS
jgi:hypothetical protein